MGIVKDFIGNMFMKSLSIPMTPKMICLKEYCLKRANGSKTIIDEYESVIREVALSTGAPLEVAAMMSYSMLERLGVPEK